MLLVLWSVSAPEYAQAAGLSATPTSASFGTVAVGTKNTQTIQVHNGTTSLLSIAYATVSGNGFSVSGPYLPLSLQLGWTASFTVAFAPPASGTVYGTLTLKNLLGGTLASVPLSGTGSAAIRTAVLSTSLLNFGSENVGGTLTLGATLINTGNSSITVSQVSASGSGFSVSTGIDGVTLAAGQTAILHVTFAPKVTGSVTGKITVTTNAANSPLYLTVEGAGLTSSTQSSGTTHSVDLSWNTSTSANVIGYYVYRSRVSGASYSRLNASPSTVTWYSDESVTAGDTYYYVVTAVNSSGQESAHSAQISATVP